MVDAATKLTWQRTVVSTAHNWQGANDYCKALPTAGGGWRLPTVRELRSIADFAHASPAIDPAAFPGTPSEAFWSFTSYSCNVASHAWYVIFDEGGNNWGLKADTHRVRCVRS